MQNNIFKALKRICLAFIIICITFSIKNYTYAYSIDAGYYIENYDIDIKVNENNTYNITETIDAYFTGSGKHGIVREIPTKNYVYREDESSSTTYVKIKDIMVSEQYEEYTEGNNVCLQIGSADVIVSGKHKYIIKYTYDMGNDILENGDEFYFNLVGTGWDCDIQNVTFKISFPKWFDESLLGFSHGHTYNSMTGNVNYKVDSDAYTVTGSYNSTLSPGEAFTARITFEDGYFIKRVNYMYYFMYFVFIIAGIIAFNIYRQCKIKNHIVETVEFYPPEGKNSVDVAYLYKGYCASNDVVSLLVYLADKGYLKIEEVKESGKLFKSKSVKITKVKEYDGNNKEEELFFKKMFVTKNSITLDDLSEKFYSTIQKIESNVNNSQENKKAFEKDNAKRRFLLLIMLLGVTALSIFTIECDVNNMKSENVEGTVLMFILISSLATGTLSSKQKKTNVIIGILLLVIFGIPMLSLAYSMTTEISGYAFYILLETITSIIIMISIKNSKVRTEYGKEMLGKIRGFKRFLTNAKKSELEALVMENPMYFYDVLPYTYVLGVSDKWMKQFESIAIEPPTWYSGYDTFDMIRLNRFMNDTMNSAYRTMNSRPVESSSGRYSSGGGGGFSGGGFSGGGSGGRWRTFMVKE